MPERLVLWGPPVVEAAPADPDYADHLPGWVKKCADVGVTKNNRRGSNACADRGRPHGRNQGRSLCQLQLLSPPWQRTRAVWLVARFSAPPRDLRRGARHHGQAQADL